jgi:hypothetical protein
MTQDRTSLRRERDVGAIIGDSFILLFGHWGGLARIVAPAVLVNVAIGLLAYAVEDDEALSSVLLFAALPVQLVAFQLVSAAAVAGLNSRDQGREIDSGAALDSAQERFGDVVGASLRATGIVVLLSVTLIGIPWAIKRLVKWAFIIQSIIVDGQRGEPSLAYSESVVEGRWWITLGRLVASGLVVGLPVVIVSQVILLAMPGVVGIIAAHVLDFLTLPYGIISTTLIFFDLKTRKARHDSSTA